MSTPIAASEARASLYRLIDQTTQSHQPLLMTGKRSSAALLSADDWQSIKEMHFSSVGSRYARVNHEGHRAATRQQRERAEVLKC